MSRDDLIGNTYSRKHGCASPGRRTVEYQAWLSMKGRCLNPRNKNYASWGGRGIKICERWTNSFETFLKDIGLRPSRKHSLHRKDNDGNYEPNNCQWATAKQQARSRRNNRLLTFDGKTMPMSAWADSLLISKGTLYRRLQKWPLSRALTEPLRPY